jgi:alanine racemase
VEDWRVMTTETASSNPLAPAPPGFPACAQVDLGAISANVAALRRHAPTAELMAVVKADAYGHGLVPSARAALRGGATWLGVAQLPEALELRRAGVQAPLLSWLHVPGQDFVPALEQDVQLGISTTWALDQVVAAARTTGRTARIHLKVDTGLGRNGAWDDDLGSPEHFGLREAMRLLSHLSSVKDCPAGQGISYGHVYTTLARTRLGLVPMGYSDGVPRNATNVGPVLVGDRRHTVAGRVCMDQFVLDLGPDASARAGDEVVLFGVGAAGEPTAQDWAAAVDTINYEIVTRVGAKVPRVHLDEVAS